MNDKVLLAIASVLGGAGGIVVGILVRQPEISKLQKQVERLQVDIEQLEGVVDEQNAEIAQMIVSYKALKVYQISQRRKIRQSIQDELICQYAAADYLTLLMDCVSSDTKMSKEDLHFYKTYSKMLADNQIDNDELEILRPLILARHPREIERLKECDIHSVFNRIREYGKSGKEPKYKHLFSRQG